MTTVRIGVVLGEVLNEADKLGLPNEVIEGFSTAPSDWLSSLPGKLEELPKISQSSSNQGGVLLHREQSDLSVWLVSRPAASELVTVLTTLLAPPPKPDVALNILLVYAGLFAEGSGHWLLSDYVFNPTGFIDAIEKVISAYPKPIDAENQPLAKRIHLHIGLGGIRSGGEWRQIVSHRFPFLSGHPIQISVNGSHIVPHLKPSNNDDHVAPPDLTAFREFMHNIFAELPDVFCPPLANPLAAIHSGSPTLHVVRPCLYVFPECSGQSAIFTLPGYSMLIDAGCGHRPSFWPVAAFFDRLDSVFITHWGVDNVLGLRSVLPVAFAPASKDQFPEHVLCLLTPPPNPTLTTLQDDSAARSQFSLSLPREMSKLLTNVKRSGVNIIVHPLLRGSKLNASAQSIQLYHKVGQGTLDLFPLTPADDDSAEVRKITDDWSRGSPSLMTASATLGKPGPANKFSIPLLSHTSVSALVIWRPAHETTAILRILFIPSNAHQTRVLVSLDAVVAANIYLRHYRTVPADFERKRPANLVSKRINPSTAIANASSLSSVDTSGTKLAAKGLISVPKTPDFPRHPKSAKAVANSRSESSKGVPKTTPAAVTTKEHEDPFGRQTPSTSDHICPLEPEVLAAQNGCANGYHDDPEKLPLAFDHLIITPTSEIPNLVSDVGDPIAAWGNPQGLPLPVPPIDPAVIGKSGSTGRPTASRRLTSSGGSRPSMAHRNGAGHIPGYTDASAHALGAGAVKLPPYDKIRPLYVDVSFVPGGGNSHLVDAEWFKRVRARYYVATDPAPSATFMESLVVGKESWTGDDARLPVSVIFSHESEDLLVWLGRHAGRLAACCVDVAAIASRCNIQLLSDRTQPITGDTSSQTLTCSGYRIDL